MGRNMNKTIISLILLLLPVLPASAVENGGLSQTAPARYTVVEGDTLWSIAGQYLKEPWRWPELWGMNRERSSSPHRLHPGDVLALDRSGPEPRLQLVSALETVRLSPKIRSEPLEKRAVPSISPAAIEPFLSRPLVVARDELDSAARIVATEENRVVVGAGNLAYARGIGKDQGEVWQIFRRGDALVDPDSRETLGFEAIYLGEARVRDPGDEVATIEIIRSTQEIHVDDRLLPAAGVLPVFAYVPRPPQKSIRGRIVSAYGSLRETGPASIVAVSKGSSDGLEVGHVLAIYRSQGSHRYEQRTQPLFGRSGPSGSDAPRPYQGERLRPRDGPVYAPASPAGESDIVKLPDERYGLVMIFRTFDRASFGLVMQASRPVSLLDVVTNP